MSFSHHLQIISQAHLNRRQALIGLSLLALSACSRAPKPATKSTGSYYTCTMHPFVHSQDPHGKCPICGMDLQLVTTQSNFTSTAAPGMANIPVERLEEIGAKTQTVTGKPGNKTQLIVSSNAVLPTGNKYFVFVDHGSGQIEPREIKIDNQSGDTFEIISGLKEGDSVFISAIFLIDAECRIQGVLKTWGDR